jgi:crotonobetainyl-CoA hydratase
MAWPLEVTDFGHVRVLTIQRPEVRNALNLAAQEALIGELTRAETDTGVRVIVLTGAGDQAFCAGADLKARAHGSP